MWFIVLTLSYGFAVGERTDSVQQALEYVRRINKDNCGIGTGDILQLAFDVTIWNRYTDPAIRTANLLSKLMKKNNGTLDSLEDEMFFLLVRNNVHGESIVFGSGIAIEPGAYSKYRIFCPYAFKKNGTVRSHDIAVFYNYLNPNTEWFYGIKGKSWPNITVVTDGIRYRENNYSLPEVIEVFPVAGIPDGYWTKPYFDCGGGDIWMVTYSAPILKLVDNVAVFQGLATIDIELTHIDINQCNTDGGTSTGLDIFSSTHRCQPTTHCVPERGKGFVAGAYLCQCNDGLYFPNLTSAVKAYTGTDIDGYYRKWGAIGEDQFRCVPCAAGCDVCVDGSPCLFQRNEALVVCLLILNIFIVLGIGGVAVLTYLYRAQLVFKSASPIFLQLMCLGGVLMSSQFFTLYSQATLLVCSLQIWPIHLGFVIMYGSLMIKTWRIAVIFSVGTQKRVKLPDQALVQRILIMILICVCVLSVWTFSQPPSVDTLEVQDGLKFYVCYFGMFEYAVLGAEIVFLLYSVYLCFTVRKAPAHFNESKHITWAVYNAIILGSFMALMSRLVVSVVGPDIMLLLNFTQINVYSTVTIMLIFVPKFVSLLRKETIATTSTPNAHVSTITGRVMSQVAPQQPKAKYGIDMFTQTEWPEQ